MKPGQSTEPVTATASPFGFFDRKCIITSAKTDCRLTGLFKELERVGIDSSECYVEYGDDAWADFMEKNTRHVRCRVGKCHYRALYNHYQAVKRAYLDGCRNILVMEDDIMFLNDIDYVRSSIKNMPDDYDVVLFDYYAMAKRRFGTNAKILISDRNKRVANDFFSRTNAAFSLGCYALSRNGMKMFTAHFDDVISGKRDRLSPHIWDRSLGDHYNMYISRRNVAIQKNTLGLSVSNSPGTKKYRQIGISDEDYGFRTKPAMSIEDLEANSFYITVDDETSEVFRTRFSELMGFVPRKFTGYRVNGISTKANIMISHVDVVKMAAALDLPFVCVFEDDALPRVDAIKAMEGVLRSIPDDAKILYVGWCGIMKARELRKVPGGMSHLKATVCGAHAYILFREGYDEFLKRNSIADRHFDRNWDFFPDGYYVVDPIFIQANIKSSVHGHVGYSGGRTSDGKQAGFDKPTPPIGFEYDPAQKEQEVDNGQ